LEVFVIMVHTVNSLNDLTSSPVAAV
jgi:hypothetical protein